MAQKKATWKKTVGVVIALVVSFLAAMRSSDDDPNSLLLLAGELGLLWLLLSLFLHQDSVAGEAAQIETKLPSAELNLELSELRRKQKLLIDRAVDVILTIDTDSNIVSINDACKKAWGYDRADLLGKNVALVLDAAELDRVKLQMVGGMKSIDKVIFESQIRKKDGSAIDVVWTGHWSASEGGLFCIVHDISAQKLVEKTIRENEQRLREFSAMVTHDLKTPLSAIMNVFTILENQICGDISEQAMQLVRTSKKQLDHMVRLLDDMLQVASMDAGTFELSCTELEMQELVSHAVQTMQAQAESRDVSIKMDASSDCVCNADEQRLAQVLINLLSNAIKYSNAKSTIVVSLKSEDGHAVIRVADQGRGIPERKLAHIFERYGQVEVSDSREKGGYGLGLAICKNIIEKHGGQIGVETEEGKGSTFWFSLPLLAVSCRGDGQLSDPRPVI